jgi:hypothetical protein
MKTYSKINTIGLISLIFLLFSCHQQPNNFIKEIDISQSYFNDKEALLSEIATDIKYVKLQTDTNCLIGQIYHPLENLQFSEDKIFISDGENLFVFENSGKFLTRIGNQGRGPEEFSRITNFTILPKDSLIVIFSDVQKKAFIYTYDNRFEKDIKIDFWPLSISSLNKEFMVFGSPKGRRSETDYYALSIINSEGEIISHLINYQREREVEKKEKLGIASISQFYNYFDTLSYWEFQYDTIWRIINENRAIPEYFINSGPKRLPFEQLLASKYRSDERDNYVKIWEFMETKRFLFLKVGYEIYLKHILYDKQSKQSYNIKYSQDNEHNNLSFINDIDGGNSFWPLGNVSPNKVFSIFYGHDLKEILRNKVNENKSALFGKNNKKILDLIENSNPTDNPIIMIVTVKD